MGSLYLYCFLILFFTFGSSKEINSVSNFHISPHLKESHQVSLEKSGEIITCVFSFDTTSDVKVEKLKPTDPQELFETITRKNKDNCLERRFGEWNYQVCLGKTIVQSDSTNRYELGTFKTYRNQATSTVEQSYEGGTACDGAVKRRSTVKLACGPTLTISSVEEPSMCNYVIIVASPDVCNHPLFAYAGRGDEQAWYLDIHQVNEGDSEVVVCSVQDTGFNKMDSIDLGHFSLSFDKKPIKDFRARHPNRSPFLNEEIEMKTNGIQSKKKTKLRFASITTH